MTEPTAASVSTYDDVWTPLRSLVEAHVDAFDPEQRAALLGRAEQVLVFLGAPASAHASMDGSAVLRLFVRCSERWADDPSGVAAGLWLVCAARLPTAAEEEDLRWQVRTARGTAASDGLNRAMRAVATEADRFDVELVDDDAVVVDVTQTFARPVFVTGIQRVVRGAVRALQQQRQVVLARHHAPGRLVRVPDEDYASALARAVLVTGQPSSLLIGTMRAMATTTLLAARRPLVRRIESDPAFAASSAVRLGRTAVRRLQGTHRPRAGTRSSLLLRRGGPLLLPELTVDRQHVETTTQWNRLLGASTAVLFYDAIPLTHPEHVPDGLVAGYAHYARLLPIADVLLPISHHAALAAEALLRTGPRGRTRVVPVPLPEAAVAEVAAVSRHEVDPALVLSVGSLEPRKNHVRLVRAVSMLHEEGVPVRLTLVGRRGGATDQLDRELARVRSTGLLVEVDEGASDAELSVLYERASVVAFVSEAEGYGLPIVEALAHGTPVVCSDTGSMREVAQGGGCLLVSPWDVDDIAAQLRAVLTDAALRAELTEQAGRRPRRSWADYADDVAAATGWSTMPSTAPQDTPVPATGRTVGT